MITKKDKEEKEDMGKGETFLLIKAIKKCLKVKII